MKQLIISIILLVSSWHINAQCIVDAGPPIRLCDSDTTRQVLNASIIQGIAPYKIAWSYTYEPAPGIIRAFTASDYLNDTTTLQPSIRYIAPDNELTFIKLEVEDSNGSTCSDWVEVTYSLFLHDLDATPKFVKEGDSIHLCVPSHSYGGFQPYSSYNWSLADDISGSVLSDCIYTKPIFKADCYNIGGYIGKVFTAIIKDAYGCEVRDGDGVAILTTGINENNLLEKQAYCTFNHETRMLFFNGLPTNENHMVTIYDMSGRIVLQESTSSNQTVSLENKLSSEGIYIVQLSNKQGIVDQTKMFFEQ